MPLTVRDGGTWRTPDSVFARVGGAWTRIDTVYTRVGGVWVSSFVDRFDLLISGNLTNVDLRALCVSSGWNEIAAVTVTVNGGVYISGNGVSNAMVVSGSFPNGVTLINNGVIIGFGGVGGAGGSGAQNGFAGGPGYTGFATYVPITIANNGFIAGGGGGGGGGAGAWAQYDIPGGKFQDPVFGVIISGGGGGGGGGRSSINWVAGGAAGAPATGNTVNPTAGGSGRTDSQGAGGGGSWTNNQLDAGDGASGGFYGQTGGTGQNTVGYGSIYYNRFFGAGGAGGAGGLAVWGNNQITWAPVGVRYGGIFG